MSKFKKKGTEKVENKYENDKCEKLVIVIRHRKEANDLNI